MNHYGKYISRTFKLSLFGLLLPFISFAQNQLNTAELEISARSLLEKYIYLSGEIKPGGRIDPARPFIQLFQNPRIMVFNDLNTTSESDMISIRDYSEEIKSLFPKGLLTSLDLDNMKIRNFPDDLGNRIIVEFIVKKTVEGTIQGQIYRHTRKVIFMIGFDLEDGQIRNLLIHGIKPVVEHDSDIILALSPAFSRILNRNLMDDARFDLPWDRSWNAGLRYQYMISSSWGIGVGLELALNRHRLNLDKFDPLEGRNPNLKEVEWTGELYYLEFPLYAVYQYKPHKKLTLEAQAGVYAAYRIFEDIQTSAINSHSGERLYNVMTDPYMYSNISKLDMGLTFELGIRYALSSGISLFVQAGYRQGLKPLDKNTDIDLGYDIYQGQFNPLFYKTETSSYSQFFPGGIGVIYRIARK